MSDLKARVADAKAESLAIYERDGYPSHEYKEARRLYERLAARLLREVQGHTKRNVATEPPRWWKERQKAMVKAAALD